MSKKHKPRRRPEVQVVQKSKRKAPKEDLRDCANPTCKNVVVGVGKPTLCSWCRINK